jgi:hypothetical protein
MPAPALPPRPVAPAPAPAVTPAAKPAAKSQAKAAKPVERATRTPEAAPPRTESNSSRCSDILQKASLEALTAEETAFLRKVCK